MRVKYSDAKVQYSYFITSTCMPNHVGHDFVKQNQQYHNKDFEQKIIPEKIKYKFM